MTSTHRAIEIAAAGVELTAVAIIVVSFFFASIRFLLHYSRQATDAYEAYKLLLGKALLLGLEFLVAADVIRTVALEPTLLNIEILGALVAIRTFLSWSLVVEMEGRWPWQTHSSLRPRMKVEGIR